MAEEGSVKTNGEVKREKESPTKEVNGTQLSPAELESRIIEQVEYYFGDYNLPRDKFLQQQIKLEDGWVPLDVMIKFNRLAKLSTDLSLIADCLKKSESGLLEISEDKLKIRRNPTQVLPEMNEARRQELMLRTLYVKGFPEDAQLDEIQAFFAKYTKVDQIVMRKHQDKAEKKWIFKGSVFAVFPSIEEGNKLMEIKGLKYGETDLIIKWQRDHINEKRNRRIAERLTKKQSKKNQQGGEDLNEDDKKEKEEFAKGAVLSISDCPEDLTREDIKTKIEEFGIAIAFIDYFKGNKEGYIRLQESGSAEQVMKKLEDGKMEFNGNKVAVRALEGEEEADFLIKVKADMAKRRHQGKNQHKRKGGKREGGGNANWRKRRASPSRDEGDSPHKKLAIKVEAD